MDSLEATVQQLLAHQHNSAAAIEAESLALQGSKDELRLLKHVKEPALDRNASSVDDVFHRVLYGYLRIVQVVKSQLAALKQGETFNKIFHRTRSLHAHHFHGKEARQEFLSTHTSFEIAREYAVEISLAVGMVLIALFVVSSLLLGLFLCTMWLLYNSGSNK